MQKPVALGNGVELARTKLWVPPPGRSAAKSLVGRPLVPRPFGCFPVTNPTAVKRLVLGTQASPNLKAGEPQAAGEDEASQLQLNGLLLSACSENETASASTSATEGLSAFTYALMRTLPASGEISVTQLHEAARQQLAEMGFQQTPLLRVPASPADLASSSFVTLAPAAPAAGQPAKALPAEAGGESTTTDPAREDPAMTDQQAYDQQFWRTVERVAAQVVSAAGNQAPGEGKSFAPTTPTTRPAIPLPANGSQGEPAGATTLPANPAENPPQAGAPGQTRPAGEPNGGTGGPAPRPAEPGASEPTGDGAPAGEEKWIGAALSIAGAVAPLVIDAFRKRPKDFAPEQDGERLAESVSEVVAPAIVDAIASRAEDFSPDQSAGAPSESGDGAGGDKFPWGAVARVVASAVPSIIAEVTKGKGADPAAGEQKVLPAIAAAVVGAAAWHAIAAARGKSAGGPDAAAGEDGGLSRAATRVSAEVVPAVVRELTGQNEADRPEDDLAGRHAASGAWALLHHVSRMQRPRAGRSAGRPAQLFQQAIDFTR